MKVRIKVPKMGLTVEEVTFTSWERPAGSYVKTGDIIALVEADKASIEIVSPTDGILKEQTAGEGDILPVGETIGILET